MSDEAYPDALPVGHRLHWYKLEHVLGQGGFGITYLARDTNLDRQVAIKEYLPADYARRDDTAQVRPRSESHAERYAWGLERFALEARTLARFDHPNIVRVHSVFEANNTAYMVMRFEEGENLARLLDRFGKVPERQLVDCLLAILDGLQLVHDAGFIHRDIKPENIYMRRDGSPVLLDFGSARQALGQSRTMTILVAPGYAPLEQYYGDPITQGPWTDIYSLGATCYRAIAGKPPIDAIARAKGVLGSTRELLQPAIDVGRGHYSARFLLAIDRALQLNERDRPQDISAWRRDLLDAPVAATAALPVAPTATLAADTMLQASAVGSATAPAPVIDRRLSPAPAPVTPAAPAQQPASAATTSTAVTPPAVAPPLLPAHDQAARLVALQSGELATATLPGSAQTTPTHRRPLPLVLGGAATAGLLVVIVMTTLRPRAEAPVPEATAPATATMQIERASLAEPAAVPAQIAAPAPAVDARRQSEPAPPATSSPRPAKASATPPVERSAVAVTQHQAAPLAQTSTSVTERPPAKASSSPPAPRPAAAATTSSPEPGSVTAAPVVAAPSSAAATQAAAPAAPPLAMAQPSPPQAAPPAMSTSTVAATGTPSDIAAATRRRRDEQVDAAETAMRRGDHATAIEQLTPLANAGVTRAQVLLGRAYEERGGRTSNNFEAYIWYSVAARGGEPGAAALKDRVAGRLQPAEIHQAEQIIERWKPRISAVSATTH